MIDIYNKNTQYYHNRIKYLLPFFNFKNKKVLDVGCGQMILKAYVLSQGGQYIGIDKHYHHNDIHFIQCDLLEFEKYNSLSYDYIFCLGVFDHITTEECVLAIDKFSKIAKISFVYSICNPSSVIASFIRCLKRKGLFKFISSYQNNPILFLLKIPLSRLVFKLPNKSFMSNMIATEVIYSYAKEQSAL